MSPFRRLAVLFIVVGLASAVGCGSSSPPPASEAPRAPVVDTMPVGNGSLIRGSNEPAPSRQPESPPPPKPGEIVLPEKGGTWPWNLAAAPAVRSLRPVTIPGYLDPGSTTTGVVVSPAARLAVVLVAERVKGEEKATRVVWCDLAAGTIRSEWNVKGVYTPLDLHSDGRRLLAVRSPGEGRTELLELWTMDESNRLRRQSWQPHEAVAAAGSGDTLSVGAVPDPNQPDPGRDVRWAAFAGAGRVVSASRAGQLRVFDADSLQRVGTIDAVPGSPGLTPDGAKVVFLTRSGVALLDPLDAKVIGVRSVGEAPAESVLTISPDGKSLACAGKGRVNLLDLTTGAVRTMAMPKLEVTRAGHRLGFGWAGDRHLLADRFLYDPARSEPVWDYGDFDKLLPRGRETWVVLRPGRDTAMLRSFVLPHPAVGSKSGRSTLNPNGIADAAGQ